MTEKWFLSKNHSGKTTPCQPWLEGPYTRSERQHSRYAKTCYKSLSKRQRLFRCKYISQPFLHFPDVLSLWRQMYDARQDQALNYSAWSQLCHIRLIGWQVCSHVRHAHSMEPDNWRHCHSTTSYMTRQQETFHHCRWLPWSLSGVDFPSDDFGLTQNPVSVYLRFGRRILISVLSSKPDAQVKVPDIETLQENVCWCTMDCLKMYLQEAGSTTIENASYYNGWKQGLLVESSLPFFH
jgi:hypothetical protein